MTTAVVSLIASLDSRVVLAAVAFIWSITTFIVAQRQRQRKNLVYDILFDKSLVTVDEGIRPRVQVLFAGKELYSLRALAIKFANQGNTAIAKDDYIVPVSIKFPKETDILKANISKKIPEQLPVSAGIDEHGIKVSPCPMNPGTSFVLYVILGNSVGSPQIGGYIKGISKIVRVHTKESFPDVIWLLGVRKGPHVKYIAWSGVAMIVIGLITAVAVIYELILGHSFVGAAVSALPNLAIYFGVGYLLASELPGTPLSQFSDHTKDTAGPSED